MRKIGRTLKRRRKEGKTDYKSRLGFLKSGKPRLVFRKTNRYIIGQIVSSNIAQDKVIVSVSSKKLLEKGWPKDHQGSLKSLTACYLTGYMLGKNSKDIKEAIFDIGLQRNVKKSRIYAFLKGFIDAGINVPHNKASLPSLEIINKNEKIKNNFNKIMETIK